MNWQPSCRHLPDLDLKHLSTDDLRDIRKDIKNLDQQIMEEIISRPLSPDMVTAKRGASPQTSRGEGLPV